MGINLSNLLNSRNRNQKIGDFQDLDHLDGVSVSTTSANLYNNKRDDLVLFYFRGGANHASMYTQSKIVSDNIKWNLKIKNKKIKALLVNTKNANVFTDNGFLDLKLLADDLSEQLTELQTKDEDKPEKIKQKDILFASTGTIGESFPTKKLEPQFLI